MQEDTAADSDGVEGSAGGNYHSYPDQTDDDDVEGSGPDDFEKENKKDYSYTDSINNKEVINVDDEIDPREVDIGFHEESSSSISLPDPVKPTQSAESTPSSDPDKQSQETNFFAQPGILAGTIMILSEQFCIIKLGHPCKPSFWVKQNCLVKFSFQR